MPFTIKLALRNWAAAAVLGLALAGCVSAPPMYIPQTTAQTARAPANPARQQIPPTAPARPAVGFRTAQVMNLPGLEGVIGARAEELQRKFGAAQLDIWEGDARKLQFSGSACVMDVYLYPPQAGAAPVATHVEARRESDGQAVDRAACVRALQHN